MAHLQEAAVKQTAAEQSYLTYVLADASKFQMVTAVSFLPLEQAVRKMTSLPASRLRLRGKGVLQPGADADVCVFDPARLHERGTYTDPAQEAEGMDYVFVGGRPAIADGEFTQERAGRVLRR